MKNIKIITILVLLIALLSTTSALVGIFTDDGPGIYEIKSFRGETIRINGTGLYKNDSVSVAAQGVAQDIVTLFLGVPLLMIGLYLTRKGSLKGKLLLTGTLGYFLYTYISYTFLCMYNSFFLVYVILMSTSFFAFTMSILSIDMMKLSNSYKEKLPVKLLGGLEIFFAIMLFTMWMGMISPTIINGFAPKGIEHYTTLVIQGLDLGFIVPIALIAGITLIKRKPIGYLLSSVIIMKGFTMGVALTAMIINQYLADVRMSIATIVVFPVLSFMLGVCMVILLKNLKEEY